MCFIAGVAESAIDMLTSNQRIVYVVREGPLQSAVSVRYRTLPGTAQSQVDYIPVNNKLLTFDAGVKWMPINVTTVDSGTPAPNLIFYVVLYDALGKENLCVDLDVLLCYYNLIITSDYY